MKNRAFKMCATVTQKKEGKIQLTDKINFESLWPFLK